MHVNQIDSAQKICRCRHEAASAVVGIKKRASKGICQGNVVQVIRKLDYICLTCFYKAHV